MTQTVQTANKERIWRPNSFTERSRAVSIISHVFLVDYSYQLLHMEQMNSKLGTFHGKCFLMSHGFVILGQSLFGSVSRSLSLRSFSGVI